MGPDIASHGENAVTIALLSLLLFSPSAVVQEEEGALGKDKSGMKWALPFTAAKKASADGRRLLLIKPVAFGTSSDGGW